MAVVIVLCLLIAGCRAPADHSPLSATPQPPPEARHLNGTWKGTYRIERADPSNCGSLVGCATTPIPLTLTLAQAGETISGTLQLGPPNARNDGRFQMFGRFTAADELEMASEPVPVTIECFGGSVRRGESRVFAWSTRLVAGKSLVGTFSSDTFRVANVGGTNLCPVITLKTVDDVRLTRSAVP